MSTQPHIELVRDDADADAGTPLVYVIDAPEHPFDLQTPSQGTTCALARVAAANWNDALTPWPAPSLRREDPAFGGEAARTLAILESEIPAFEQAMGLRPQTRAIMGYSLGGLFALYALCAGRMFDAAASVSGSLWYDDWTQWLEHCEPPCAPHAHEAFAYVSVGTKEKRAAQPRIKRVEDCTRQTEALLRSKGVRTQLEIGPGSHFARVNERLADALRALAEQTCHGEMFRSEQKCHGEVFRLLTQEGAGPGIA